MLLGSGELGKEVLIALQRLGVETIAVDRYENAPGQQVAHHARTITMSDGEQLKALIEEERPDLVVPEIEAIATPMLEAAGSRRRGPRDPHRPRRTADRWTARASAAWPPRRWACRPARTSSAIRSRNSRPPSIDGIGYPCVVKPVMSSSGKGQSKIDGPAGVRRPPGTTPWPAAA